MALPATDQRPEFLLLEDEILNDPAGIGYAGMNDATAAAACVALDQDNWVDVTSSQIFEYIDPTEFQALTNANEARVDRILGLGEGIKTAPGSQARAELVAIFGGGSTTITTLASIANQQTSRAQIRGIRTEFVTAARIAYVRA